MGLTAAELGRMRHLVRLEEPSATTADAFGGYTQTWAALNPPDWWCSVNPSPARSGERRSSNTAVDSASYLLVGRVHPNVTTATRVRWTDKRGVARVLSVVDVDLGNEIDDVMKLSCAEVTS